MLSDDDIIGIAVREADHLDATRVHEMKAGKWQATTMLEDSALIRLARAILTAAAERAAPTVPMDADHWAELYRLREDVKGPDGHATWKDAAIAMRAALTVDGRCTFPACACGPDKCIAEDTDSAPGPVSASPVTPAADRGAADGDGRLRQGEEGCTFSYTCNDPAHAALPAVLAHNLRGIANAIRTGGFEKGELASYADMLDGYAALPTARAEPVAWIDPDYKLGAPYGKPTAPVITYPQRDWLPLYYAAPQVARQEPVTFDALRAANLARLPQFKNKHGELAHSKPDGSDWSPAQWLQAVVGELGEYANLRKKFERGDLSAAEFARAAADELADVQTYLDILAFQVGVDLGRATVDKFNRVSERVGCAVRLATLLQAAPGEET